jgi:hypothetical protein
MLKLPCLHLDMKVQKGSTVQNHKGLKEVLWDEGEPQVCTSLLLLQ